MAVFVISFLERVMAFPFIGGFSVTHQTTYHDPSFAELGEHYPAELAGGGDGMGVDASHGRGGAVQSVAAAEWPIIKASRAAGIPRNFIRSRYS
jgi:hypothetical protein